MKRHYLILATITLALSSCGNSKIKGDKLSWSKGDTTRHIDTATNKAKNPNDTLIGKVLPSGDTIIASPGTYTQDNIKHK